jgi:hypothetical protein
MTVDALTGTSVIASPIPMTARNHILTTQHHFKIQQNDTQHNQNDYHQNDYHQNETNKKDTNHNDLN